MANQSFVGIRAGNDTLSLSLARARLLAAVQMLRVKRPSTDKSRPTHVGYVVGVAWSRRRAVVIGRPQHAGLRVNGDDRNVLAMTSLVYHSPFSTSFFAFHLVINASVKHECIARRRDEKKILIYKAYRNMLYRLIFLNAAFVQIYFTAEFCFDLIIIIIIKNVKIRVTLS